jgi:uncharacterized membrane protein YvbJ
MTTCTCNTCPNCGKPLTVSKSKPKKRKAAARKRKRSRRKLPDVLAVLALVLMVLLGAFAAKNIEWDKRIGQITVQRNLD